VKNYWISFGANDPRTQSGLSPTFIQFFDALGHTLSPPGITEIFVGSGAYKFQHTAGYSTSVWFLVDGATSGLGSLRYVSGVLDPIDTLDVVLGYTGSSIGTTSVDPGDLFGHEKRRQDFDEGVQTFLKSSGQWSIFSRGASTLLTVKTLTNSTTGVTAIP
jgi:hypothetical protein